MPRKGHTTAGTHPQQGSSSRSRSNAAKHPTPTQPMPSRDQREIISVDGLPQGCPTKKQIKQLKKLKEHTNGNEITGLAEQESGQLSDR